MDFEITKQSYTVLATVCMGLALYPGLLFFREAVEKQRANTFPSPHEKSGPGYKASMSLAIKCLPYVELLKYFSSPSLLNFGIEIGPLLLFPVHHPCIENVTESKNIIAATVYA